MNEKQIYIHWFYYCCKFSIVNTAPYCMPPGQTVLILTGQSKNEDFREEKGRYVKSDLETFVAVFYFLPLLSGLHCFS